MKSFFRLILLLLGNVLFMLVATSFINFALSITFMTDFKEFQHSPTWFFAIVYLVISTVYIIHQNTDE